VVEAWRIVKTKHAPGAFSGEGARLYGGRWTSRGRRAVYASATVALATLEIVVQLETASPLGAYSLFRVLIPDDLVSTLDLRTLPRDWRRYPAPATLQALGDAWLDEGKTPALRAPSAIVPSEFNYVLAPEHPAFRRIKVGRGRKYDLDPRLSRA
jgi:RES domain-containing protein